MQCSVIKGDIAEQSADALVNAAGTSLRMGSGVAGALRQRGGEALNEAAVSQGPIELGDVAITDGFDLDAKYVIHAAAMPHYGDGQATEESIRAATRHALEAADRLGCESIVLPAIGCGVAGFEKNEGAAIICDEIAAFEASSLTDVRLIGYTNDEYDTLLRTAETTNALE